MPASLRKRPKCCVVDMRNDPACRNSASAGGKSCTATDRNPSPSASHSTPNLAPQIRVAFSNRPQLTVCVALGRQIDLAEIRIPVLLLAGTQDELISIDQLFAVSRLVGTPQPAIEM